MNHVPGLPELKEDIVAATSPLQVHDSLRLLAKMLVAAARKPVPSGPSGLAGIPKKQLDVSADSELVSKAS